MDAEGPFDDMVSRDQEDSMPRPADKRMQGKDKIPKTSRKNSNVKKGERLKNMVNMLKRERSGKNIDNEKEYDIDQGETHHHHHMGGHESVFLNR